MLESVFFALFFVKNLKKMNKSNFREWTLENLEETFGLQQQFQHDLLDRILSFEYTPTEVEKAYLALLQNDYIHNGGEDWNEGRIELCFQRPARGRHG